MDIVEYEGRIYQRLLDVDVIEIEYARAGSVNRVYFWFDIAFDAEVRGFLNL